MALEIKQLTFQAGTHLLLEEVSFTCQRGEIHGLLGPNGAGKTTLFSLLMGLNRPTQGKIKCDGQDITSFKPSERVHIGLSFMPQESCLFLELSVLDNIIIALEQKPGKKTSSLKEQALSYLSELNIESLASKKAQVLSGGQKRRCEFARLLACQPAYALLDEPFAGVDPLAIVDIQEQIQLLARKNIGVLISDHHVEETLKICHNGSILFDGKILVTGSPSDLRNHSCAQEHYFGSSS